MTHSAFATLPLNINPLFKNSSRRFYARRKIRCGSICAAEETLFWPWTWILPKPRQAGPKKQGHNKKIRFTGAPFN